MRRRLAATAAVLLFPAVAWAQDMPGMEGMDHAGHHPPPQTSPTQTPPPQTTPPANTPASSPPAGPDMSSMPGMDPGESGAMTMSGALGPYSMNREASGTAWQPDASAPMGRMVMRGPWMFMGHAVINGVYDSQSGPRGDEKAFVSGMIMGMAERSFLNGDALQFRAMLSPDPPMGARGYPLLLASGETADGVTALVDRQHPHDLFMELSLSYSHRFSDSASLFVYGGLPGEPAFGPPAFMHRASIMDSPEAPISHHWLDSTHITFGVITAGVVLGNVKLEASRFRGREPDQHRYDIETGALDSTAVRLSWNPTANWSLQASWVDVASPEQLEPDVDQTRWSASAIYARPLGEGRNWTTTAAWGRRISEHDPLDAWMLESAVQPWAGWTIFARAERTENNELTTVGGHHGPTYTVSKASVGAIRDFRVAPHIQIGLGALVSANAIPSGLEAAYGNNPTGAMAFIRLKID